MHPLLSALGVSAELQDWFGTDELSFDYGDEQEVYGADFHRVPVTADLWLAGNYPATELIVTSSAMEAIAYMALNRHRHPPDAVLSFIAVGNLPHPRQLKWISSYCLKRKITLVFPDDLAGRVADIVVAAGIRGKAVRAEWVNGCLRLLMNRAVYEFTPDKVSLNAFEKAAGIRSAIRTRKPLHFNTFLEQLHYDRP